MNPLCVLTALVGLAAGLAAGQYSDPASHGFTINAPGLTNTATFGYGAGLSAPSAASRPALSAASRYVPLSRTPTSSPRLTISERAFTLTNIGSVGGPNGSVIGERRLLTSSKATLPRQAVGAGVPSSHSGTTVVNLSNRGQAPPPLSNYFGGSSTRLVGASGLGRSPLNPTLQREPPRYQYAPPQARGNFAPSHGYTVNAPGFTKHKTFAGPAVHGTNQAFLHVNSG